MAGRVGMASSYGTVAEQRFGSDYSDLHPLDAYGVIVHLPHLTAAEPDNAAIANERDDVREAFSRWQRE